MLSSSGGPQSKTLRVGSLLEGSVNKVPDAPQPPCANDHDNKAGGGGGDCDDGDGDHDNASAMTVCRSV